MLEGLSCSTTCSTKGTREGSKSEFEVNQSSYRETQVLALDCERILTVEGEKLARVSIVNFYGNIVFDTLVKPSDTHSEDYKVLDYREWITGIKPIDLQYAPSFNNIEPILRKIFKGKTIIGHSVGDDLSILKVDVERDSIEVRDVSKFELYTRTMEKDNWSQIRRLAEDGTSPSKVFIPPGEQNLHGSFLVMKRKLRDLADEFLNAKIQQGQHSSVIDARVALALYRLHYSAIEIKYRCNDALIEVNKNKALATPEKKEPKQASPEIKTVPPSKFATLPIEASILGKIEELSLSPSQEQTGHSSSLSNPLEKIKFLMLTKSSIFNVTPPHKKDESRSSRYVPLYEEQKDELELKARQFHRSSDNFKSVFKQLTYN